MGKAIYRSPALTGAFWMVLAGVVYAAGNVLIQQLTMKMGFASSSVAFWQYGIALLFAIPYLWRTGLAVMRTAYPGQHIARVALSALGVQAWVFGLQSVPISQAIALVMTSPFFIIVGAKLFLGERVGPSRWIATAVGFSGALLILQPWSASFTWAALLPVLSALLWGGTSLITKKLTAHERPESITVWLLMLLTPINALVAVGGGFAVPMGDAIWIMLALGLMTVLAQYFLTLAYSSADAAYVQPFDDLKLPLNVLGGWLVFGFSPDTLFWVGGLMILGASLSIMMIERRRER
ncbi:DMT family transporter [Martelella lutilitoris]|uniref:DMT family transporter n=1 Tax=Martelella lutilitoris TaxID=2583532 RepID=A0A7T7HN69_9HYPH|nr:DMT family transporter [Martelella lutilitoris]QQM32318.1 DMT family transporter [Martelella lutilitoris]